MRIWIASLLLILCCVSTWASDPELQPAEKSLANLEKTQIDLPHAIQFEPYANDRVYMGFGFGIQLAQNEVFQTPIAEDKFVTNDCLQLLEQIVLGYDLFKYFGVEGQFTFFPSTVYNLTPHRDSIIRKVYSFSGLLKFIIPIDRFRIYFGGGGSIVYTLAPPFEIYVSPESSYAPMDEDENPIPYINGQWGHRDFFRPEYFIGLGLNASKRVLISIVYSCIYGAGQFQSSVKLQKNKEPTFAVNPNYLPNLKVVVLMITMKI